MTAEKTKVVILGGGYAGLMTAVTLQKKVHPTRLDITLVNKHDYHYFTTKVHEAGAGTIQHESIKMPISEIIDSNRVTFIKDKVIDLDLNRKTIQCENNTLHYDYVVVSVGGAPKTFNIPGLEENSFFLLTWNGTYCLRKHIEEQFQAYHKKPEGNLNIVIGGTGFTAMEFIHELQERIPLLCQQYGVTPRAVHLIIVEQNKEMLQGLPDTIVRDAVHSLKKMNCEYKLGVPVSKVEKEKVILEDGTEIPTKTFIWAGGVTGNPILQGLGLETFDGRIKLNEFCEVPGHPDVYVLGDASVCFNEKGMPYPPTAQIAIQQGQYCGYNIAMKIYGQKTKPFHYIFRGTVMSLGKGNATGIVYNHHINGHFGAFMKRVIEMRYYYMLGGLKLLRKQWKKEHA